MSATATRNYHTRRSQHVPALLFSVLRVLSDAIAPRPEVPRAYVDLRAALLATGASFKHDARHSRARIVRTSRSSFSCCLRSSFSRFLVPILLAGEEC